MPMSPRLLRPRASGVFNPKSISGLIGWWDANDSSTITLNGTSVSEWRDKSGSGFHVSQATAAQQPTYVTSSLAGKAGIDWGALEGVEKRLFRSPMPAYSPRDVFVVADYDGSNPFGNFTGLFHHASVFSGGQGTSAEWTGGANWSLISVNNAANSATVLPAMSSPFFLRATLGTNILAAGATSTATLTLGAWSFAARGWAGKIYEVFMFSSSVSATERDSLRGYVRSKWGINT